jgi:hypothetical protein
MIYFSVYFYNQHRITEEKCILREESRLKIDIERLGASEQPKKRRKISTNLDAQLKRIAMSYDVNNIEEYLNRIGMNLKISN